MIFGLWTAYGALNSKPVFEAFRVGANRLGYQVRLNEFCDVNVIWSVLWQGRMKKNEDIWNRCVKNNLPIIVLEVGAIKRGYTWKVGVNGVNRNAFFGPGNNDNLRRSKFNLTLKDWSQNNSNKILIAGQHQKSGQWQSADSMKYWLLETISRIKNVTDKKIIVRPHPRSPLSYLFDETIEIQKPIKISGSYDDYNFSAENFYAVINFSSNPGIHAAIEGTPVFVSASSLAWEVSNKSLDNIHNLEYPDRKQWLNDLCYTEWTVEEIATGFPLLRLTNFLKDNIIN